MSGFSEYVMPLLFIGILVAAFWSGRQERLKSGKVEPTEVPFHELPLNLPSRHQQKS